MLNLWTHNINGLIRWKMLFSPAELAGERKVNWKVKKEPCLLSQRISWEQNKDGKNVLENKAVSGSRGLSSDIALWLLISARKAQPIMIRKHSLLSSLVRAADS